MKLRYVFALLGSAALSWHLAGPYDAPTPPQSSHQQDNAKNDNGLTIEDLIKRDQQTTVKPIPKPRARPSQSHAPQTSPRPHKRPNPDDLKIVETYNMGGKSFNITASVQKAFKKTEARFGIPYDAMIAVCGRESDCVPTKINGSSKACGLFQFMTNNVETLYEVLWKYGPDNGYADEAALVERYITKKDKDGNPYFGYRPVSSAAKEKTIALCLDPEFNATMWAAYHKPLYERYNDWLGNRTITVGEIVGMNNLGLKGLEAFAKQAWTDASRGKDTLAVDFFKAHRRLYGKGMASNRTLVRHDNGRYKTVREAYNDIFSFGGYQKVDTIALSQ